MNFDVNAFNFDSMKEAVGIDPFAETANKYAEDTRFYKLTKDKNGNGAALIRFLPDSEKGMIKQFFKINTTITKNGKKRFVDIFSPSSAGLPCPFQEKWQELWNAGDKDGAKAFGRGKKYIANIKILKDPAKPENEGKIFLYEMSGAMKDKIQNALSPSEQDRALGAVPKEMFNPLQGNSFRLVSKKGANGQINYDSSEVINEVNSIYGSIEEAVNDIKNNTHKLSDLAKPEAFLSYEKLQEKLKWVTFTDVEGAQPVAVAQVAPVSEVQMAQPVTSVPEVQPAAQVVQPVVQPVETAAPKSTSLDDLLAGLV